METKDFIIIGLIVLVAIIGTAFATVTLMSDNTENDNGTVIKNNNTTSINNTSTETTSTPTEQSTNEKPNGNGYEVYVPQGDQYVRMQGEAYDSEVNKWYDYDSDGVRYYQ